RSPQSAVRFNDRWEFDPAELPGRVTPGRHVTPTGRRGLHDRRRGAGERQLEYAGTTVVGDAAHDVETSRGPGDEQRRVGGKERAQAGIRIVWQRSQAVERRLKPDLVACGADVSQAPHGNHASSPRRRSAARNTGSTCCRIRSFAYPTHATSA